MRRRRPPEVSRSDLIVAAMPLFAAQGYTGPSIRQLAEAAGVTHGTLIHHFGSKRGLHEAVEAQARALLFVPPLDLRDLRSALHQWLLRWSARSLSVQLLVRARLRGAPWVEDAALIEQVAARIREGQQRGEYRSDVEPFFLANQLSALVQCWPEVRAAMIQKMPLSPTILDEMYLRQLVSLVHHGILPPINDRATSL